MDDQQASDEYGQAELSEVDDRWQLRLAGEISSEMRSRLDAVLEQVGSRRRPVDVDLAGVTFIDSSGIGFLSRLGIENRDRVQVRHAAGLTRELLDLAGLRRIVTIDPA